MDRQSFFALIPIVGMFFTGLIVFSFTRLGRALANRIEGRLDHGTEAHERLDFAERALTRGSLDHLNTPV